MNAGAPAPAPRRPDHYLAARWLPAGIAIISALIIAALLLDALEDARRRTERLAVDLAVRNMRTGMQLAQGEAMMQQRGCEIAGWVGANPVDWMGGALVGYVGECPAGRQMLPGGTWCFDKNRRELAYFPHSGAVLREERGEACSALRWRVGRAEGAVSGDLVGLRIEPASACRWRIVGG